MIRNRLRQSVAASLAALPRFRGKGRLTMALDRLFTNPSDPDSYRVVANINGAKIILDLRFFGERFNFYYREYEPEYVAALRALYKGGNFLDIGSNIGLYVVAMAGAVRAAGGRIFSVEPVPSNAARQRENLALNGCTDLVDLAMVVLGAERGTVRMGGDFDSGASVNAVVTGGGTREFPMVPLDDLARERGWTNVGALKIDVEGYEPIVLQGGAELLRRDRPVILAEFNRERMAMNGLPMEDSWRMLLALGYRGHTLTGGELHQLSDPGDHENLFFLPPDR